jgi:hypothetical protein
LTYYKMKLKTVLIILIVFFILRTISSPYASTPTAAQLTATAVSLRAAATAATNRAAAAKAAATAAIGTSTAKAKAATAANLQTAATKAVAAAVKAEAAAAAAGGVIPQGFAGTSGTTGGTTGGTTKWLLLSRDSGAVVQYDKTTTPPTWSTIMPPMPLTETPRPITMKYGDMGDVTLGNMITDKYGTFIYVYDLTTKTFSERSKNTQNDTTYTGVSLWSAYHDFWAVSMGNMLIGWLGHVTIYDPVNDVWSPVVQAPTLAVSNSDYWQCVMGSMIISRSGMTSVYTPGPNGTYGTWSPAVQGPTPPTDPTDNTWWMTFGGHMVLSRSGWGSIYTASSGLWSTPVVMLPYLDLGAPANVRDAWVNVLDDMVISYRGLVYKYNTNQTFTQIQNVPLPDLLNDGRGWFPVMKLN